MTMSNFTRIISLKLTKIHFPKDLLSELLFYTRLFIRVSKQSSKLISELTIQFLVKITGHSFIIITMNLSGKFAGISILNSKNKSSPFISVSALQC